MKINVRLLWWAVILALILLCTGQTDEDEKPDEATLRRRVELKSPGQLRFILSDLEIPFDRKMSDEELRELAYQEDAIERWWVKNPKKRPMGGYKKKMAKLLEEQTKMKADPEKRKILEELEALGVKMTENQDIEALRAIYATVKQVSKSNDGDDTGTQEL